MKSLGNLAGVLGITGEYFWGIFLGYSWDILRISGGYFGDILLAVRLSSGQQKIWTDKAILGKGLLNLYLIG